MVPPRVRGHLGAYLRPRWGVCDSADAAADLAAFDEPELFSVAEAALAALRLVCLVFLLDMFTSSCRLASRHEG